MAGNRFYSGIARLFGFEFRQQTEMQLPSPVTPNTNDGAVLIGAPTPYGYQSSHRTDLAPSEHQLVTRYREMALHPLVDWAVDEVTNECVIQDGETPSIQLDLSKCEIPDEIKQVIQAEFDTVLALLNWKDEGYEIFRNWYIDGRLYYQLILVPGYEAAGIQEIRYIDPRQIRKVAEIENLTDPASQIQYTRIGDEYFMYSPNGIDFTGSGVVARGGGQVINGVRLTKDSVVFIHSGRFDPTSSVILSNLHKAMRPLSQLKSMENATLIYKISRSPERRVWKIPVGQMPEKQVSAYMQHVVAQYRTKQSFDATSGDVIDDRNVMSIVDDIFIPVPSTGEALGVETIPGGQGFDDTSTIDYFNTQLLRALSVPPSRLRADSIALFGNTGAIAQDERKFAKLVFQLRKKFAVLFSEMLTTQLRLKGIVQQDGDLEYLKQNWQFVYASDNYYSEISESAIFQQRLIAANEVQPFVGRVFSNKWVRSHIFKLTDEEQMRLQQEIAEEMATGEIAAPGMGGAIMIDPATGQPLIDPKTGQPIMLDPLSAGDVPPGDEGEAEEVEEDNEE